VLRSTTAALAASLALAGCSGGGGTTAGDPSASPSSSSWPPASVLDVREPELPDLAYRPRGGDPAARAFIRYIVAESSYVLRTGFVGDFYQHTEASCLICAAIRDEADRMVAERYLREGGEWEVVRIEPRPGRIQIPDRYDAANQVFVYRVTFVTTPLRRVDEDGTVREGMPARTVTTRMQIHRFRAQWWVANWWVPGPDNSVPV
jgi:hypothetical protein